MKSQEQAVARQSHWTALTIRQQEQLLTLLGKWALGIWETQKATCSSRVEGDEDEPDQQQDQI